jgi:hypothetical protein
LIVPLIIQTILPDPFGSGWTDETPNLSRPDTSGADQIDTEHQATELRLVMLIAHSPVCRDVALVVRCGTLPAVWVI